MTNQRCSKKENKNDNDEDDETTTAMVTPNPQHTLLRHSASPGRQKKKHEVPADIAPNGEADISNEHRHLYLLLQGSR